MVHSELRVHGVSGTPPRDMLYTDPVSYDQSNQHTKVYRERFDDDFETEAFHWGSLTAGHWTTAFWILLAPFAFANVAGWMARGSSKSTRTAVRLAGLALTMLMVMQGGVVALDIGFSWASTTNNPGGWLLVLIFLFALFVWSIMGWLSTQSHFRRLGLIARLRLTLAPWPGAMIPIEVDANDKQQNDPAGKGIEDPELWNVHAIVHRLRRLHLALSYLSISLLLELGAEALPIVSFVGMGFLSVVAVLTAFADSNPFTRWLTAILPLGSLAILGIAAWRISTNLPSADGWPHIHQATFTTAVALGVFTLLIPITAVLGRSFDSSAALPVGSIVVGTFIGASYGIAAALIAGQLFGIDRIGPNGADWVAVAMLGLVLWVAVIGFVLSMFGVHGDPDEDWRPTWPSLRRVVVSGPYLFSAMALYGIVIGAVAWMKGCKWVSCDPASLGAWPEKWTTDLLTFTKFGFTFEVGNPVWIAKFLLIIGPAYLIARRLLFGARDAERRRQVGILWDLGSFWPRWYHPLAPPAYGPNAVTRMRQVILSPSTAWREIGNGTGPSEGQLDVLSAHSQGSLVAVVAMRLLLQDQAKPSNLPQGFVTYGSQLGLLYPSMFPTAGIAEAVAVVSSELDDRWINLWRPDDPIGGHYINTLGAANWRVLTGSGHSQYELTHEFCAARNGVLMQNVAIPDRTVMLECWKGT